MNEQKISFIERKMLHPHPENPRKDLGDLEELRESIRENGIMQNLTVVPDWDDDGYKILIGHRRFAASEGIINLLDPEMEAVIDGTSELYLIDGKEVK